MTQKGMQDLPVQISVNVQKGQSGALVATLDEYDAVTEGNDLIELFFNVNDLIYTIFDVSKKQQESVRYIPSLHAQKTMVEIAKSPAKRIEKQFDIQRFIRDSNPGRAYSIASS
ncbi:hypothetical protein HY339_00855 [Candidatus Gottesmanbacteria bacterium]|nr:hypothetical protein [Candidatus Gottesmanbacteria bacterium]